MQGKKGNRNWSGSEISHLRQLIKERLSSTGMSAILRHSVASIRNKLAMEGILLVRNRRRTSKPQSEPIREDNVK